MKEVAFTVPWEKVKKLGLDAETGLVAFVAKGPYKGQVQVKAEGQAPQALLEELQRVAPKTA